MAESRYTYCSDPKIPFVLCDAPATVNTGPQAVFTRKLRRSVHLCRVCNESEQGERHAHTVQCTSAEGRMRPAVLYARVSSKDQEREGFSIPAQLKFLREYAQSHKFTAPREVRGRADGQDDGPKAARRDGALSQ